MSDIYSETEVYHTLEIVGKGTFGKVVKCWRGSDGELVAVKIMKIDINRGRVIKNELKLIAALSKTNLERSHIVRFYEAFRDQTHHYLVFEMLEKNLYQLQKENGFRPLAIRNIRTITCQILMALAKLKELAIIHADLKPENIMIVDQCRHPFRVKLIDFGSASIFNEVRFVKEPYIQSRFYRSPEILLGLPFCEKVDMWSLGCVMAELFLGWPLYPGESEFDQIRYICETQGLPRTHLLNSASKTHLYFKLTKNCRGATNWQLKSVKKIVSPGAGQLHVKDNSSERRKYILTSLDQLHTMEITEHDQEFRNEDVAAEITDRHCMVELIKRTLTLDSHQRINPSSALRHQFITMQHLRDVQDHRRYYEMSLLEFQQALISSKASVGDSARSCQLRPEGQLLPCHREAYQTCLEGKDFHSQTCLQGQHFLGNNGGLPKEPSQHTLRISPVQRTTEQMEDLCIMDKSALETSWSEDSESTFHTPRAVISELKACPLPSKGTMQESAQDLPPHCLGSKEGSGSMLSYFTSFLASHSFRRQMARPSQSDPTHGLRLTPGLQDDGGNPEESPSHNSPQDLLTLQEMVNSQDRLSPQDLLTPQDVVAVQDRQIPQDLEVPKEHAEQACDYAGFEQEVQFVPYDDGYSCHCAQWPTLDDWTSSPDMATFLNYGSSACPSTSQQNLLHF